MKLLALIIHHVEANVKNNGRLHYTSEPPQSLRVLTQTSICCFAPFRSPALMIQIVRTRPSGATKACSSKVTGSAKKTATYLASCQMCLFKERSRQAIGLRYQMHGTTQNRCGTHRQCMLSSLLPCHIYRSQKFVLVIVVLLRK